MRCTGEVMARTLPIRRWAGTRDFVGRGAYWQDDAVRSGGRGRHRSVGLLVLFGVLMLSLTGCLRVHAALAVSPDDLVSGELIIARCPSTSRTTARC